MDEELTELRQQIADLAELTVTMRRRANLPRYRQDWIDDRAVEERLVARIERWVRSSQELLGEGPRDEYQSVVDAARGRPRTDPVHSPRSRG